MSIPLHHNRARATWLEISPAVQFFGTNSDPATSSRADEVKQTPLNHLTHNVTPKFWARANLRYQMGGQTKVDGVKGDNKQNILGGGLAAGYQVLPPLSIWADYDSIIAGDNGAKSKILGSVWSSLMSTLKKRRRS